MKTRTLIIVVLSAFAAPAMATTFIAQYVSPTTPSPAAPGGPQAPTLMPGLYLQVIDGAISVSNRGGTQQFSAGQFGYTASPMAVPVLLPKNPGMQFTPPPTFSASNTPNTLHTSPAATSNSVDCEVR